jgi:hypothetical protein
MEKGHHAMPERRPTRVKGPYQRLMNFRTDDQTADRVIALCIRRDISASQFSPAPIARCTGSRRPVTKITRTTRFDGLPSLLRAEDAATWMAVSKWTVYDMVQRRLGECAATGRT